VGPIRLRVRLD
jgi:hypothetical protein